MRHYFQLALISFCLFSFICCTNTTDKKKSTTDTNTRTAKLGLDKTTTGDNNKSNSGKDTIASNMLELLQGKWQHVEDKTNYLVFAGNHRKEIAGGMDEWDDDIFVLSDKCLNESSKNDSMKSERSRYISCEQSDLCWYIDSIDKDHLSLIYMRRGNTLSYTRVK